MGEVLTKAAECAFQFQEFFYGSEDGGVPHAVCEGSHSVCLATYMQTYVGFVAPSLIHNIMPLLH